MMNHGHVYPRPDGRKARCGGPALCTQCRRERMGTSVPPLDQIAPPSGPPAPDWIRTQREPEMPYADLRDLEAVERVES